MEASASALIEFLQRLPAEGTVEVSLDRVLVYIDSATATWAALDGDAISFAGRAVYYSEPNAEPIDTIMLIDAKQIEWVRHVRLRIDQLAERVGSREDRDS